MRKSQVLFVSKILSIIWGPQGYSAIISTLCLFSLFLISVREYLPGDAEN